MEMPWPECANRSPKPLKLGGTWNWIFGCPVPAVSTKPPDSTTFEVSTPVFVSIYCSMCPTAAGPRSCPNRELESRISAWTVASGWSW